MLVSFWQIGNGVLVGMRQDTSSTTVLWVSVLFLVGVYCKCSRKKTLQLSKPKESSLVMRCGMTEEQSLAHIQPLLEDDLSRVPLKFKSIYATNLTGMLLCAISNQWIRFCKLNLGPKLSLFSQCAAYNPGVWIIGIYSWSRTGRLVFAKVSFTFFFLFR